MCPPSRITALTAGHQGVMGSALTEAAASVPWGGLRDLFTGSCGALAEQLMRRTMLRTARRRLTIWLAISRLHRGDEPPEEFICRPSVPAPDDYEVVFGIDPDRVRAES